MKNNSAIGPQDRHLNVSEALNTAKCQKLCLNVPLTILLVFKEICEGVWCLGIRVLRNLFFIHFSLFHYCSFHTRKGSHGFGLFWPFSLIITHIYFHCTRSLTSRLLNWIGFELIRPQSRFIAVFLLGDTSKSYSNIIYCQLYVVWALWTYYFSLNNAVLKYYSNIV